MTTYTIELNDAQKKAMEYIAADVQDWIENSVYERARLAIEEIVSAEVQRKLANGEPISGTKEDIVLAANIELAAERNARIDAERANLLA